VSAFMSTVRCAMITRAQAGVDADADVARSLREHHELNLGVYCGIDRPGVVRVGDPVTVG